MVTLAQHPVSSARAGTGAVASWLVVVAILIFSMVVLGGVTRLTRSGLSIVEWEPVTGVIPPLSERQWQAEFDRYQRTPEYQQVNVGMSLDAFKRIYWVEWLHRLLGRLIGLVFFVPLVYFAIRRQIPKPLVPKLIAIFVLGGLQGALGWYMVKSGLINVPHVSPYRLTAHLGLAVIIYAFVLWIAFGLRNAPSLMTDAPTLRRFGWFVTSLIYLMMLAGGLVAGTKAGFAFNTFPLMNGHFVPPGMFAMQPRWMNIFHNVATVQFDHRLLAYCLIIVVATYWWLARSVVLTANTRRTFHLLPIALIVQVGLGITTLLAVVPVWLGALHQAGALTVFTIAIRINHALRSTN